MRKFLIIAPEDGMLLEAVGVADILQQANRMMPKSAGHPHYEVAVATTQHHRVVQGRSGLQLLADRRLSELDPGVKRDTIMITGRGRTDEEAQAVADWVRMAAPRARRIVSVCSGALLLARTGLLDGRRATAHWRALDDLQAEFPLVDVQRGPIYVQDGPIWTSAGVTAGFDLTLALVEDDHGFELARDVAQDLVMYLRRPGGQSQFSRQLLTQARTPGPIRDLQSWILEHLAADLSVEAMARHVAMSPRHFTRTFTFETGVSPAKYVEEVRLESAKRHLERGAEGLERIASAVGFGSALNLRRVFERNLRINPSEYRERFGPRLMA